MSKLSHKEHWDRVHGREQDHFLRAGEAGFGRRAVQAVKGWLGEGVLKKMSAYDAYLQWNVIFPRHLEAMNGRNVVEVGSAPGDFLVEFSRRYGCVPHGIEYSQVGVELNRKMFVTHGFNPDNVIHTDFFSKQFQQKYKERFHAVISRGFVEHFSDVSPVLDLHMNLLAPGGYLILSIPNLRGLNYILARVLDKQAIPRHNLQIMKKEAFAALFERDDLEKRFCDYYGTFNLCLFTSGSPLRGFLLRSGHKIQPFLNIAFHSFLGDRGAESATFSPALLYIGRKRGGQGR
jgi:2-polyprenyl-3-methyl-5-hydroxy-6-metoxy-1,4-benzoquinol methylase